jgi:hypothetical protein
MLVINININPEPRSGSICITNYEAAKVRGEDSEEYFVYS